MAHDLQDFKLGGIEVLEFFTSPILVLFSEVKVLGHVVDLKVPTEDLTQIVTLVNVSERAVLFELFTQPTEGVEISPQQIIMFAVKIALYFEAVIFSAGNVRVVPYMNKPALSDCDELMQLFRVD